MAAPKYLKRDVATGQMMEVIATESGPTPEAVVSTGPGGTIDPSLLPATVTGGSTAVAGEAISTGAYVYVKLSGSPAVPTLFNAVWSVGGSQAIGFVTASWTIGQTATYFDSGQNASQSGLTPGVRYYGDHTTPGGVTNTVPSGAGVLAQFLGYSVSTTTIESDISDAIILAS
jgi:hypothetical protein